MTSAPNGATARQKQDEAVEVVRLDACRGLGVRARQPFAAGSTLHLFAGTVSDQICQHSLQVDDVRHLSDTRYIGYLSHGCDPNCRLDMTAFALVALKDVTPGDILTIDYAATEDRLHRQFACRCGAAGCRGWITGRSEQPDAAGRTWLALHNGR
jgi:hypothetical protein